MRYLKYVSAILAVWALLIGFALACEGGHWIESVSSEESVSSDGRVITLEDGSVWEVDSIDRIDSMLWLPVSEIVACDDKLINTNDDEAVVVVRIR